MILFSDEYLLYTILGIVLLPGILFAIIASYKVNVYFKKYKKVEIASGLTGGEVARKILDENNLFDVKVIRNTSKELVDNYDPQSKTITLSSDVFDGNSISAVGIASHEVGHAVQHAEEYSGLMLRSVIAKTSNFASRILWPLLIMGFIFNFAYIGGIFGSIFLFCGIAIFFSSFIFSLITLPVELNASKRALNFLVDYNIVDTMEVKGCKKVLNSAALTYVAALVISILELLRFILYFLVSSRD